MKKTFFLACIFSLPLQAMNNDDKNKQNNKNLKQIEMAIRHTPLPGEVKKTELKDIAKKIKNVHYGFMQQKSEKNNKEKQLN